MSSKSDRGAIWLAAAAAAILLTMSHSADAAQKNPPKTRTQANNDNNNSNNDVGGGDQAPPDPPSNGRPHGEDDPPQMGTGATEVTTVKSHMAPSTAKPRGKKEANKIKFDMPYMMECKKPRDCAKIANSSCEPYPMDRKGSKYCVCGDLEPPMGANCTAKQRVVHFPCSANEDCVADAECAPFQGDEAGAGAVGAAVTWAGAAGALAADNSDAPRSDARLLCRCKGDLRATDDRKHCLDGLGKLRYDMQMKMASLEADQMQLRSRIEDLEGGAAAATVPPLLMLLLLAAWATGGL